VLVKTDDQVDAMSAFLFESNPIAVAADFHIRF
jgi:hypothetical protein